MIPIVFLGINLSAQVMVKDICPATCFSDPSGFINANGTLIFAAKDVDVGNYELWKSDGTTAGTQLILDINSGTGTSMPYYSSSFEDFYRQDYEHINGITFFKANDGINGSELWKTDGTSGGTSMVKNIWPGTGNGLNFGTNIPCNFTNMNGALYFIANDSVNGLELWKSDGTALGTTIVKDIYPGSGSSFYAPFPQMNADFIVFNNELYFGANDQINGENELWKTDGTAAGTILVKDIYPGNTGSDLENFTVCNGQLFFSATDGANGQELWKTDGTTAGTVMVKDINATGGSILTDYPGIYNFAVFNDTLYFPANDGSGYKLWKSDGTAAGTVMVSNAAQTPSFLTPMGSSLYFRASDATNGREFWKTDGTASGTVLIKDIRTGSANSDPEEFIEFNDTLYFSARTSTNGIELWRSDGTTAGTIMMGEIEPGSDASSPIGFTIANNNMFFSAFNSTYGIELWKVTSGTFIGVDANTLIGNIHVYPNPSSDIVFVELPDVMDGTIELINLQGQVLQTTSIQNEKSMFDASELSTGIYLIKLNTAEGTSVKKFIKK